MSDWEVSVAGGPVLRHAAFNEFSEAVGKTVGGLSGDALAVIDERGIGRAGRKEPQRPPTLRQIREREHVLGCVEVGVEIIDAELVEVAEHDVARAVGHEARPVIECLPIVLLQIRASLFHFDQHDGFPNVISEGGTAAVFIGFADAEFGGATYVQRTGLAKSLKEPVEEDLGLALFIAGDVLLAPANKFSEFFGARHWMILPCHEQGRQ